MPAGRWLSGAAALAVSIAPALAGPVSFDALPGWATDDHAAAFAAFHEACGAVLERPAAAASGPADPAALATACRAARALPPDPGRAAARRFFEARFRPERVGAADGGFLTGYFEPELRGSRRRHGRFRVPLYRLPDDVVAVSAAAGLDPALTHARRRADGALEPYPDRAAIEAGALAGRGLEIVWLADPVDAFFAHVQGSVRVRLDDGAVVRLGFAGRNGRPYTPIARRLIERGEIAREDMTAERLAAWLRAHPDEAPALMAENPSYIFFREIDGLAAGHGPVGALGVPLTPGRSLAVDPAALPLGVPVFLDGTLPLGAGGAPVAVHRLVVAADTGAAIRGPGRGDLFVGTGAAAGRAAGRLRHPVDFVVLVPRPEAGDGR